MITYSVHNVTTTQAHWQWECLHKDSDLSFVDLSQKETCVLQDHAFVTKVSYKMPVHLPPSFGWYLLGLPQEH